jgi:hypothetical protein
VKICLASLHPRRLSGQVESLVALGRELEGLGHTVRLVTAFEAPADAEQMDPVELEAGASARGKLKCMLRGLARLVEVSRDVDVIH